MRQNSQLPLTLLMLCFMAFSCQDSPAPPPEYASFEDYPVYEGDDLGLAYSPERSAFRLWSPAAADARIHLYSHPTDGGPDRTVPLKRDVQGTWLAEIKEDLLGMYYTFQVQHDGEWLEEAPSPYAKAVGTNGVRAQVIDLAATNPDGWGNDRRPKLSQPTDAIVYELHIRDISVHPGSGITHKGKFLGLAEEGTQTAEGIPTGLSHLKEMGITHVHLLPSFDFRTIDESRLDEAQYNWGYDPQNYNVPEGSYSMDPADGASRIREFKTMVKALHDAGIGVILDVVYNHTGATQESLFNQLVPGYYYRQREDGSFSDASACGNETASDRPMVRKFIVESVKYWAEEYHLDGFRFDLMAIHDIETMNEVAQALHHIDPSILVYGEGWTAGDSPLPVERRALKAHTAEMPGIAAFSDDIRDGLKGSVFEHEQRGFVSGAPGRKEDVKFGIAASARHPQVDLQQVSYTDRFWAGQPTQTMTYVSCHDNHTLWDRLAISCQDEPEEERIKMHRLALATVLTAQGISFLHAGTEMLRTKQGVENSYNAPDSINQIDWNRKAVYRSTVDYVKGLIALRKAHPAFRMTHTDSLQKHLKFLDTPGDNLIAYTLSGHAHGDSWAQILVVLNGQPGPAEAPLPQGEWTIASDGQTVSEEGLGKVNGPFVKVPGRTAMILFQ